MALNFPSNPSVGQTYVSNYATYTWDGSSWATSVVVTASGGYLLNSNTITSNVTLASGYNALSVGPLTIAANVVVTQANSTRWLIL